MKTRWYNKIALRGLGLICLSLSLMIACSNPETAPKRSAPPGNPTGSVASLDTPENRSAEQQSARPRKTVLDYYRALPKDYALPYTLRQKDRIWYARYQPTGQERQALVDLENGFMEMSYLGNDTISESVQVALFRMQDDRPVLAVGHLITRGMKVSQNYYFVRPEHPQQFDWTEHTLPIFTAYDFFHEDTPGLDSEYLEEAFPILLKLPHYGTQLEIQPYLGRRFYYCREAASAAEQGICPLFDQLERRSFQLSWNPTTGRFE